MARQQKLPLLSRLHGAISKVRFFVAFDIRRWLHDQSPAAGGKLRCISLERQLPQSPAGMLGCASSPSAESNDIDRRAEEFIESFYRQLRMERQVSLRLNYYCSGKEM